MLTHRLTESDDWFIKQNRIDSISRTPFAVGHEVVVCGNHHVMLADFYSGQCNESGCGSRKLIQFSKRNVQPVLRLKSWKDYRLAFALTAVIGFVFGFLICLAFPLGGESTVNAPSWGQARVIELSVDEKAVILELGQAIQLTPHVLPERAAETTLMFSSSAPDVAQVNSVGLVTATPASANGEDRNAVITIETWNGVTATVEITVRDSYYACWGEEQVEIQKDTATNHTTPLVFSNTVPNCTGFTYNYCVNGITQGAESDFEGQEFCVYGRTKESEWHQIGSFICEGVGTESRVELSFSPRELDEVACVMGNRIKLSENSVNWSASYSITDVRYIN